MGKNSALSLGEDSSKLLSKGEEREVAGVWGLQATVVASYLFQTFTCLLPSFYTSAET